MQNWRRDIGGLTAALLLWQGSAAALDAGDKCESAKLKAAGKYGFCRLNADATALKTGGTPDYSKCDTKYAAKWSVAETNGAGMCPSSGDQSAIQSFATENADAIAVALAGGSLPSCPPTAAGVLKTPQVSCFDTLGSVIACAGTGQDGELQRGVARSYTADLAHATVVDNSTGLTWQGLDASAFTSCTTTPVTWATAFAQVDAMNASNYLGYNDWRLPNINELQSIVDYGAGSNIGVAHIAALDPTFFSFTIFGGNCLPGFYWSSTTVWNPPDRAKAWGIDFVTGAVQQEPKYIGGFVRAVRGGQ